MLATSFARPMPICAAWAWTRRSAQQPHLIGSSGGGMLESREQMNTVVLAHLLGLDHERHCSGSEFYPRECSAF